jgi:serine/threonine protein kinase/Tol biopolymer transport system component
VTPDQHRRAGELFDRLAGVPPALQLDQIDAACGSDDELRRQVIALLEAERRAPGSFLGQPAINVAANLLVEDAAASPVTGIQLGAYLVGSQVGMGGMGSVYEARDVRLDRKAAVKILPPAFVGDPERVQRFRQEARAASHLNHPNIVSIFDADFDRGHYYIATEYVEGRTLRQLAAGGPLDVKLLLDIAIQICSALDAAHQAKIVHRDIKPENVMLRPDGIVKVLDFGLAKLVEPSSGDANHLQTRPGSIAGTLHYLSPEQVMGRPAGPQSDIFSLGVMLYELATGVRPFTGPTEGAIFSAILNHQPARPADVRPALDRDPALDHDVDTLILRAMEKDPDLRFQTANDLRSALKLLARGSQSGMAAVPPAVHARKGRWTTLAIGAVVAAALGSLMWFSLHRKNAGTGPLPGRFLRLTDGPGEEVYPNLSPDGSQFFYSSAIRGKWDIYLQRTGGNAATNLTVDSKFDDTEPALSRDGSRIAFRSERDGGGLFAMETTGENPIRITTRGHMPAWSPDGKTIVYSDDTFIFASIRGGPNSRMHVVDLASGAQRNLQTADAVQPNWSPHGYRIAYWGIVTGGQRDIWTVGVDGTAPVAVTHDPALDWNPVWSPSGDLLYFISDRGGAMNLWRVPIDERSGRTRGEPEPVTTPATSIKFLNWSADGTKFVYSQEQHRISLFSIDFDAGRQETPGKVVPVGPGTYDITNFSLSPDGTQLAYDTLGDPTEDIWISNLDGTGRRRLTSGGFKNRVPSWSPRGDEITFFSNRSAGRYNTFVIRPDGSGLRQLTAVTQTNEMQGAIWLEGGKRLLAGRNAMGMTLLDPSAESPLTDAPSLPGFENFRGSINLYGSPLNGMVVGYTLANSVKEAIFTYFIPTGKLDYLDISGRAPMWMPGPKPQFIFIRDTACYLYDVAAKREKLLFSVAPNRIYAIYPAADGKRIYFTQTIRDADVWLGTMGSRD